jgi:hypothetical protein
MATTTNYSWTTPDDTALVKDGASAIRSLGTSIDTTTKALNPSTTLGDIEYRSSTANTNTRLGIGSTGQVLTVAGGVPSWTTPTGSTKSFSLLNSGGTALTGNTTITVSGISGIDDIFIMIDGASSANASANFRIRLNTDSNANYTYSGAVYQSSIEPYGYTTTTGWIMATMSNNAISYMNGQMLIRGCNSTGTKICQWSAATSASSGSGQQFVAAGGFYTGNTAITSVSIFSSNGNFDAGTIYIYGSA